jgi:hypothetical protein
MSTSDNTAAGDAAAQLLAKAEQVFAHRSTRRGERPVREDLIGTIPANAGQVIKVFRRTFGRRVPLIDFRYFAVSPDGDELPLTWGMRIRADALPQLAGLIGKALDADLGEVVRAEDPKNLGPGGPPAAAASGE